MAGVASAAPIYLCLAEKAGTAKSGGVEGKCPAPTAKVKYARIALPAEESEQQKLLALLQHIKYEEKGIGGKPTIQFSGVNVQIVNGEGNTATTNGAGNLVIGYDEEPYAQTGSHNLALGGNAQEFTSFGGMVMGTHNNIKAPFATVTGGEHNTASGASASVSGGYNNTASSELASVSGGQSNAASGPVASVSGGSNNTASGPVASVSGGYYNTASGHEASVSGGESNTARGEDAWIGGGYKNEVFSDLRPGEEGLDASIFGGDENKTAINYAAIP